MGEVEELEVVVANHIHLVDIPEEVVSAVFLPHRYHLLHEKCRIQVLSVVCCGDFKTNMGFWDASKVAEVRKNGREYGSTWTVISSDGRKVIPPIVIPDDASPEMRAAAQAYVNAMAQLHNEKFGCDFTGKVKTRGQNGRGRSNTIHTEAWSIDDTQMVDFPQKVQEAYIHCRIYSPRHSEKFLELF